MAYRIGRGREQWCKKEGNKGHITVAAEGIFKWGGGGGGGGG